VLLFEKFLELGIVRQTLMWFLEQGLDMPARNELGETCWKRPSYVRYTGFSLVRFTGVRMLTEKLSAPHTVKLGNHGRGRDTNLGSVGWREYSRGLRELGTI
jgi:hypothetical protein